MPRFIFSLPWNSNCTIYPTFWLPRIFLTLCNGYIFKQIWGIALGGSRARESVCYPSLLLTIKEAVEKRLAIWKLKVDRQLKPQPQPRGSSLCIGEKSSSLRTGVRFRYFAIENPHFIISWIFPFCAFFSPSQHCSLLCSMSAMACSLTFACFFWLRYWDTPGKEQIVACRRTPVCRLV